jgi:hypothetical protein
MSESREEILGEVLGGAPRLLRVGLLPVRASWGPPEGTAARAYQLTLETGHLLIEVASAAEGVHVAFGPEESEGDWEPGDEEDPWWTVLGQELVRAWSLSGEPSSSGVVELQFRPDGANPKIVTFELRSAELEVSARPGD